MARVVAAFGIGPDNHAAGLQTLAGDLLLVQDITSQRLIRAGGQFSLLLTSSGQAKPPLKTFEKKSTGSPVVFQEIHNLDSFFATSLNLVKPTTRLLLIKVASRRDLEKFIAEPLLLKEKTSSLA